jgi:single-strand DNA-binding protein
MASTSTSTNQTQTRKAGPVVTRVGSLVASPELLIAKSGRPFARMRILVSTPKETGNGVGDRETVGYDVTAIGTLGEHAAACLSKGDRIIVNGRGETRTWTGDDGREHVAKGILADSLGPDLRWATVKVNKSGRASSSAQVDESYGDDDESL